MYRGFFRAVRGAPVVGAGSNKLEVTHVGDNTHQFSALHQCAHAENFRLKKIIILDVPDYRHLGY
ncbi:MAG: hypothetical protein QF501_06200 [Anaerolineales bacterium]|jgi:hypothetical protein|nr:hypothetical protein [Anaerolineales bacterium]